MPKLQNEKAAIRASALNRNLDGGFAITMRLDDPSSDLRSYENVGLHRPSHCNMTAKATGRKRFSPLRFRS